jgi:hypothetical protein
MINPRRTVLTKNVAHMGWMRNACEISVGKPEWKRPIGTKRRRKDIIEMDFKEAVPPGQMAAICYHEN